METEVEARAGLSERESEGQTCHPVNTHHKLTSNRPLVKMFTER